MLRLFGYMFILMPDILFVFISIILYILDMNFSDSLPQNPPTINFVPQKQTNTAIPSRFKSPPNLNNQSTFPQPQRQNNFYTNTVQAQPRDNLVSNSFIRPQIVQPVFQSRIIVENIQKPIKSTVIETRRPLHTQYKVTQLPEQLVKVNRTYYVQEVPEVNQNQAINQKTNSVPPPNIIPTYQPPQRILHQQKTNAYPPTQTIQSYLQTQTISQQRVGGYTSIRETEYVEDNDASCCCIPFWWLLCLGLATTLLFGALLYYLNSGYMNSNDSSKFVSNSNGSPVTNVPVVTVNNTSSVGTNVLPITTTTIPSVGTNVPVITTTTTSPVTYVPVVTTTTPPVTNVSPITTTTTSPVTNVPVITTIPTPPIPNTAWIPAIINPASTVRYNVTMLPSVDKYNCPLYSVTPSTP